MLGDTAWVKGKVPVSGISVGLGMRLISLTSVKSGDSPPCMQIIFSSTMAETGRQFKVSANVFQSLMLYLRLPLAIERKEGMPVKEGEVQEFPPPTACPPQEAKSWDTRAVHSHSS